MYKFSYLSLLVLLLVIPTACSAKGYDLKDIQGDWWSNCEAPAVEFSIKGAEYSGDFYDSHPLTLEGSIINFRNGFVEGHSVNVSFKPREYRILSLSNDAMLLESNMENNSHIWKLYSCKK